MGSIINSLTGGVGGNAGGAGLNYQAGSANLQNPVTADQATGAYNTAQSALGSQQALLNALNTQNGIGNQTNVYNQLQGVANGTGPNPAAAQLAQATGANTANQAALMAGQRGTSQNAGLLARQAAMQGGANQQNAAGQAATMQANQSLNALGQMGSLATNQANQQSNATQALNSAAQGEQNNLLSGISAQNNAANSNMASQNAANASIANTAASQQGGLLGGVMQGIGTAAPLLAGMALMADGGNVPNMPSAPGSGSTALQQYNGPMSPAGKFLSDAGSNLGGGSNSPGQPIQKGANDMIGGLVNAFTQGGGTPTTMNPSTVAGGAMDNAGMGDAIGDMSIMAAKGGTVKAMVSPGEKYLKPKAVEAVKKGANPEKVAETIPGKPKYQGNDYRNDVVPKDLEAGGIVVPNEVLQSARPHFETVKFIHRELAKRKAGK